MAKKTAPQKAVKKTSKPLPKKTAAASKSASKPKGNGGGAVKTVSKKTVKAVAGKTSAKKPPKKHSAPKKQAGKSAPTKVRRGGSTDKKAKSVRPKGAKPKPQTVSNSKNAKKAKMPATPKKSAPAKVQQKTKSAKPDIKKLRAAVNAKAAPKKIATPKKATGKVATATAKNVKKNETSKPKSVAPKKSAAVETPINKLKKPEKKQPAPKKAAAKKTTAPKPEKGAKKSAAKPAAKAEKSAAAVSKEAETSQAKKAVQPQRIPESTGGSKGHLRPSHNIYFSIEDLDAYFEKRDSMSAQQKTEKSAVKSKTVQPAAAKPVSQQVVPRKPLAVATVFDILGLNPVVAQSHEKLEEQDVPRKWKKYYKMLVDLRKHHSSGVKERSAEVLRRSAKDDAGDLSSYGQHLADAGSESFERDMAYNLISNQKEVLSEIEEAIKRIKNGTYGICEITGKPIPESRLMSIPYTRCTKEGQEIKEREAKRVKDSRRASIYDMGEAPQSDSEEEAGS